MRGGDPMKPLQKKIEYEKIESSDELIKSHELTLGIRIDTIRVC